MRKKHAEVVSHFLDKLNRFKPPWFIMIKIKYFYWQFEYLFSFSKDLRDTQHKLSLHKTLWADLWFHCGSLGKEPKLLQKAISSWRMLDVRKEALCNFSILIYVQTKWQGCSCIGWRWFRSLAVIMEGLILCDMTSDLDLGPAPCRMP